MVVAGRASPCVGSSTNRTGCAERAFGETSARKMKVSTELRATLASIGPTGPRGTHHATGNFSYPIARRYTRRVTDPYEVLTRHPLLARLNPEQVQRFALAGEVERFNRGESIVIEGTLGD